MCCICQARHGVSLHHIVPREKGGSDAIENAIPLCPTCHDEVHGHLGSGRVTRAYSARELRLHVARVTNLVAASVKTSIAEARLGPSDWRGAIRELVVDVQARQLSLSVCLAKALELSFQLDAESLRSFCTSELGGWNGEQKLPYRGVDVWTAPHVRFDEGYLTRARSASVWNFIVEHPKEFVPTQLIVGLPVADLEATELPPARGYLAVLTVRHRDIYEAPMNPDAPARVYAEVGLYQGVLNGILTRLTEELLSAFRPEETGSSQRRFGPTPPPAQM
jgi:hypothetical protein